MLSPLHPLDIFFLCLSCKRVFPALFLRTYIHHTEQYICLYRYNVGIKCCKEKTAKKEESAGGGGFSFFFLCFWFSSVGFIEVDFFFRSEYLSIEICEF